MPWQSPWETSNTVGAPTSGMGPNGFTAGGAGSASQGAQMGGYNAALRNLQNSINTFKQAPSFEKQQLGQQLKQNQGQVQMQNVMSGMGNSNVAQTMQQAPLQTYNMGMANVNEKNAGLLMNAYQNMANAQMQGGNAITNTQQPYAQSQYQQMLGGLKNLQGAAGQQQKGQQQGGAANMSDPNVMNYLQYLRNQDDTDQTLARQRLQAQQQQQYGTVNYAGGGQSQGNGTLNYNGQDYSWNPTTGQYVPNNQATGEQYNMGGND